MPTALLDRIWKAGCACILLLSAAVYVGSLAGTPIWEDSDLIQGAPRVGGQTVMSCFSNPFLGHYYRPVVPASFAVERPLWRLSPIYYHQTNILLHVCATAILILFLKEAFRRRSVALAGGLLFAVQPAQVGAVAWIGGRTDSLCALFMLLFAWTLIRAVRSEGSVRCGFLVACVVSYALAVFTKEQMIPALLLAPLAYRCWGSDGDSSARFRRHLVRLAPFVAIAVLYAAVYMRMDIPRPDAGERLGALLLLIGRTVTYYALLLLAPAPRWMHMLSLGWFRHFGVCIAVAGWFMLAACAALFFRWQRRAPTAAWLMAFALIALFPVLNFYPVPTMQVAPYRAAVPGAAVAGLLAWAIVECAERVGQDAFQAPLYRGLAVAGAVLITVCLWWGGLAAWGARQWTGEIAIGQTLVRYDPYSTWAESNLTRALLNAGRRVEGVASIERLLDQIFGPETWRDGKTLTRAIDTDPDAQARLREIDGARKGMRAWTSAMLSRLGLCLLDQGQPVRAERCFETGVGLYAKSPEASTGMGECAMRRGDYESAVRWLDTAVALEPFEVRPLFHLAQCLAKLHRYPAAVTIYSRVIQVAPWITDAYVRKAECQRRAGDEEGAQITLAAAARTAPKTPELTTMLAALRSPGTLQ